MPRNWNESAEKSSFTAWNWRRKSGHAAAARSGCVVAPKYSTRLQVETRTASRKPSICFIRASASGSCASRKATFSRNSTGTSSKVSPPQITCAFNEFILTLVRKDMRFAQGIDAPEREQDENVTRHGKQRGLLVAQPAEGQHDDERGV